jgi:hypothetical protein
MAHRSAVENLIVGPDSTMLVAETNNEIAGFVILQVQRVEQTPRGLSIDLTGGNW